MLRTWSVDIGWASLFSHLGLWRCWLQVAADTRPAEMPGRGADWVSPGAGV